MQALRGVMPALVMVMPALVMVMPALVNAMQTLMGHNGVFDAEPVAPNAEHKHL